MWLLNVVSIITFLFLLLNLILRVVKKKEITMYVILSIAVIFETIFVYSMFAKKDISSIMQTFILIFSYLIPMLTTLLNNSGTKFRLKILYAVAVIAYALRKHEFAAGLLLGAIRNDKTNVKYYLLRAKTLEKMGDFAGARDMLFNVVELDKSNKEAHLKLVQLLDNESKKDTALVMLAQLLKNHPDYNLAREMLGIIYSELGRDHEAESIYEELINENIATYNTYYNMAIIYCKQNKIDEAIEAYSTAIQKNSKLYDAHYALGRLYFAKDELDKAIEFLKKSIKSEYLKAKAMYTLAMCYIKQENLEEAVECLENAINIDIKFLDKAKANNLFDAISLEISRIEDEKKELLLVSYDMEESEEKEV